MTEQLKASILVAGDTYALAVHSARTGGEAKAAKAIFADTVIAALAAPAPTKAAATAMVLDYANKAKFGFDDAALAALGDKIIAAMIAADAVPTEPIEDPVTVPRGLLGAACYALRHPERDNAAMVERLRQYTVGDLSVAAAPQPASEHITMEACAKVCDEVATWGGTTWHKAATECAAWVRKVQTASEPQPAAAKRPDFAAAVAQRKWDELKEEGWRMQRIVFERPGSANVGAITAWGVVTWKHKDLHSLPTYRSVFPSCGAIDAVQSSVVVRAEGGEA